MLYKKVILGTVALLVAVKILFHIGSAATLITEHTIDYRLTVNLLVDGVEHTGTGVVRSDWHDEAWNPLAEGVRWSVGVTGEAVSVDLGARGALFVLLTGPPVKMAGDRAGRTFFSPSPIGVLLTAFATNSVGSTTAATLARILADKRQIILTPDQLPRLVKFGRLEDPSSVEAVDPAGLATSFGSGVSLKSATIQITTEAPTSGIEQRLPWLNGYRGKFLSGSPVSSAGLAGNLRAGFFDSKVN